MKANCYSSLSTTVKRRFNPFRLPFIAPCALSLALSCSSPEKISADPAQTLKAPLNQARVELSTQLAKEGAPVVVTVKLPPEAKNNELSGKFEDTEFPFFPSPKKGDGVYEALIGIPIGHKPGMTKVTVLFGAQEKAEKVSLPLNIQDGEYQIEYLKVDPGKVNPKKKDLKRIKREQAEVGVAYSTVTREKFWDGPLALPIDSQVTSPYGNKRFYNGELRNYHNGLDLRAQVGTPIHAAASGRVLMAKNLFFTGNTVILDHGYGVMTLYAHMSKLKVKKGRKVKTGDLLGLSGATGRVNGPHLHWSVIVHKAKINPAEALKSMP